MKVYGVRCDEGLNMQKCQIFGLHSTMHFRLICYTTNHNCIYLQNNADADHDETRVIERVIPFTIHNIYKLVNIDIE
jgi:hypothetical protein